LRCGASKKSGWPALFLWVVVFLKCLPARHQSAAAQFEFLYIFLNVELTIMRKWLILKGANTLARRLLLMKCCANADQPRNEDDDHETTE
jgi:hypothetical protein